MTLRPAYQDIALAYGGFAVCLRPSLRAATYLERLQDGFANLFKRVDEFDTATIRAINSTAATDQAAATALLQATSGATLQSFATAAQGPVTALCRALIPAPDDQAAPRKATTAKPMPWSAVYRELYRVATGWLQWPPETAWNATPAEITDAFDGLLAKLKAIHGAPDDPDNNTGATNDQSAANIALGLDPEFDRAGLHMLKSKVNGN